jgi:hypothetical protein
LQIELARPDGVVIFTSLRKAAIFTLIFLLGFTAGFAVAGCCSDAIS